MSCNPLVIVDETISRLLRENDELKRRLANEEATAEWRKLRLAEAVNCLQEIAAMSKKIGSETAAHWLQQHGYPREPDGYVPGRGYTDSAPAAPDVRR